LIAALEALRHPKSPFTFEPFTQGVACFLPPLRGWFQFCFATHGLRRGLYSFAASRLGFS
jgi:hypothetical protein